MFKKTLLTITLATICCTGAFAQVNARAHSNNDSGLMITNMTGNGVCDLVLTQGSSTLATLPSTSNNPYNLSPNKTGVFLSLVSTHNSATYCDVTNVPSGSRIAFSNKTSCSVTIGKSKDGIKMDANTSEDLQAKNFTGRNLKMPIYFNNCQ